MDAIANTRWGQEGPYSREGVDQPSYGMVWYGMIHTYGMAERVYGRTLPVS